MSSQSSPNIPSAEQLASTRTAQWHQNGEALLTFENLRSWINVAGLVMYTPRAQQLPAPAPSMVEAILGNPTPSPSLADIDLARGLLGRLVAEGVAVPLNLMGTLGETPDFVVSVAVLPYIFTLRGDKTWKQPPSTSGVVKVSPLALAAYKLLEERVTLSAYDLTTQLGKEVTEAAVLRALNELWSHLRVLPVPQNDGSATLWELTTSRFTKQIKAGANAGQPSALSALISLYLSQAVLASEEEIEVFLSPLSARSRIRDVVHALLAAREIETIVVEGKTLLYVSGAAPRFLEQPVVAAEDSGAVGVLDEDAAQEGAAPRIKKFVPKPRKTGTGFVTKPARSFAKPDRERSSRERRPFQRGSAPGFDKPWEEEKAARLSAIGRPASVPEDESTAGPTEPAQEERRPYPARKPAFDGPKRPFARKPAFGARPSFDRKGSSERKPFVRREGGEGRPPRRDFGEGRPPRRDFGEGRPPRREAGETRPPRRDFSDARPPRHEFKPRREDSGGPSSPRKIYSQGTRSGSRFESKPGGFAPRREGYAGKPSFNRSEGRPPRRDFGESRPPRAPRDRDAGGSAEPRTGRGGGPPYRKFDAPRGPRPFNPAGPRRSFGPGAGQTEGGQGTGDYAARPRPAFGDKRSSGKPYSKPGEGFASRKSFGGASGKPRGKGTGKPFAGKPGSPFEKFVGNKKPFGKRSPARKIKREEGESAE